MSRTAPSQEMRAESRLTLRIRHAGRLLAVLVALAPWMPVSAAPPAAGDVPPPDLGVSPDGDPVSLADHANKAVVVSFWATWCPYCLKELPILERIQTAAGKQHIQVIAVNTEDREVFRQVTRQLRTFNLQLARDVGGKAQAAYGVKGLPYMVIVGRDGCIQHIYQGYNESRLEEIVADINRAIDARAAP